MDDLALAVEQAGGVHAGREHGARLGRLLEAELRRGAAELEQPRSGYAAPVTVAIAPAAAHGLRAALPVTPALRADAEAVGERAWLLVAATVGALVDAAGSADLSAGASAGWLLLQVPGEPDAELAAVAFEHHADGIDRL